MQSNANKNLRVKVCFRMCKPEVSPISDHATPARLVSLLLLESYVPQSTPFGRVVGA